MEAETLSATQSIDFSILALFFRATLTVKIVMIILMISSIWSWSIIIQKFIDFKRANQKNRLFQDAFWSGEPLDELFEQLGSRPDGDSEAIFMAGMIEWRQSHRKDGALIAGSQARIDRAMNVALSRASDKLSSGLYVLATVGSIAPFVGLFGTVWGIKHSFEQIALQQSTNLAVVAPGIAEALLATALGLVAAIPAVIFYNKLSGDAEKIIANQEGFADEFSMILSRELDRI
ncbi:MAG: protein TolQ [Rhodobacteraceae bacterium]|nr:MAG: protein TolQ [Paracoccaceae bacterium]|tara:strand:+ start:1506 stop:2204 length:699 start_codon:yes stop_codon:yes gene_type:complete